MYLNFKLSNPDKKQKAVEKARKSRIRNKEQKIATQKENESLQMSQMELMQELNNLQIKNLELEQINKSLQIKSVELEHVNNHIIIFRSRARN